MHANEITTHLQAIARTLQKADVPALDLSTRRFTPCARAPTSAVCAADTTRSICDCCTFPQNDTKTRMLGDIAFENDAPTGSA